MPGKVLIVVTLVLTLGFAGFAGDAPDRFVLLLADGSTHEVLGPVERRDGSVVFRDERGRLGSLPAAQVVDIRQAATRPDAPPAAEPARPAIAPPVADPSAGAVLYTTADLPALPQGASPSEDEATAVEGAALPAVGDAADLADTPDDPAALGLVPEPAEAAGHPEAWWRAEIERLRDGVDDLQRIENETYRLWVCAMEGVALESGACRPRVNQQPPVNALPRTPTQRRLTDQLREVRRDLAARRAAVGAFIEDATAAGVPTAWLLEPSDPG